ncbi:MAG: hypothetical protein KJ592_03790 [Nanoarchaeota archaeon]|nr:hypothetical protein [Nanoarchaeota archaeon]
MDNLGWCFRQGKGIRIVEPSVEIAREYMKDAKRDLSFVDKKEPKWNIIKEYYVCYNSFYSLLVRCGIKCEIHDCTIKLMELFDFEKKFRDGMIDLKRERINVQYYIGNSERDYFDFASKFLSFCEVKLLGLNDLVVKEIRSKIRGMIDG